MAELQLQLTDGGDGKLPDAPEGYTAIIDGKTVKVTVDSPTATEDASQALIDAAAAKAAGNDDSRPEAFPEKFWTGNMLESQAKLLKSHNELEKKLGSASTQTTDDKAKGGNADEKGGNNTFRITPSEKSKMVDFEAAEKGWMENDGKITDEIYAAYEKMGLSRLDVDIHITGLQAQTADMESGLTEITGGAEGMKQVLEWALEGVDAATISVYNEAIDTGNAAQAKVALRGIVAQYQAENGKPSALIDGEHIQSGGGVAAYASVAAMTEAMADPRYKTHASYRDEVVKRVAVSNF